MLAVTVRAYPAAIILLDTIHRVVSKLVLPPNLDELLEDSDTDIEQDHAIKNVMSAWRSSVAGTGSTPSNNKGLPEIPPFFKNHLVGGNFELPPCWLLSSSGLPQSQLPPPTVQTSPQQSNEFSKG